MGFWDEKGTKRLFQKIPFCNALIENLRIEHLINKGFLHDLPFYHELNIPKISKAFRKYVKNYKIEVIHSKDLQLYQRQVSTEDLFKDVLDEIKGFKY